MTPGESPRLQASLGIGVPGGGVTSPGNREGPLAVHMGENGDDGDGNIAGFLRLNIVMRKRARSLEANLCPLY